MLKSVNFMFLVLQAFHVVLKAILVYEASHLLSFTDMIEFCYWRFAIDLLCCTLVCL